MNYYIQGNKEKADQIKTAFEQLGYNSRGLDFSCGFFYTVERDVHYFVSYDCVVNIIKTHPDYKELELPIESKFKFKVGDWIVQNDNGTVSQITKTINGKDEYGEYRAYEHTNGYFAACFEKEYHLWSIQDAKDGDVLSTNGIICIFKKLDKDGYYIISPCIYTVKDGLEVIDDENDSIGSCGFKPATKEDRELLFQKMEEAGYEWDVDKKELKKIQPHYDIANFKPYQKVLIRFGNNDTWLADFFSHIKEDRGRYFVGIGYANKQCIPFEGNEHLLGTTDMCPEEYINW